MIYRYLRFSTDSQDEQQQVNKINAYLSSKGLNADETITDAAVSGGVSYKERNLFELCKSLKPNDTIIISEISRITRSGITELAEIIDKYFKPNKLRLIICNVGLDVDCSDINPMIEMQLMMMATFAKIEKQLIQDRTKNALEARRKAGKEIGGTKNLWGSKNGNRDRQGCLNKAIQASNKANKAKAESNPHNKAFAEFIEFWEAKYGTINKETNFELIANELNRRGKVTSSGISFNKANARQMYYRICK